MLVYGTVASTNPNEADIGEKIAAYDYRAFGEMLELTLPATGKVTEFWRCYSLWCCYASRTCLCKGRIK